MPFQLKSRVAQLAEHLRSEITQGRWADQMPGGRKLERELGVSHTLIDDALRILEDEGLLENQGLGRRRRIVPTGIKPATLQVRILLYERKDRADGFMLKLIHMLHEAGHDAGFAGKAMHDMGMNTHRIARHVRATKADIWIVVAGAEDVLDWFSRQPIPTFALFGRIMNVPLAAAALQKKPAVSEIIKLLVNMGHRRIVNVVREDRRKPKLGVSEQFFLEQLNQHGIQTGPYHIPEWDDTPGGLQRLLDTLFQHTPPTALLLDEPVMYLAARDYLARMGINTPEHVSLVCLDADPAFDWYLPRATHITWDPQRLAQHLVRWVEHAGTGRNRRQLSMIRSKLVYGGSIGPVPPNPRLITGS